MPRGKKHNSIGEFLHENNNCFMLWGELEEKICMLDVEALGEVLSHPSVYVTSGADRTTQLGKILQLQDNIVTLWQLHAAEPAAGQLEDVDDLPQAVVVPLHHEVAVELPSLPQDPPDAFSLPHEVQAA